MKKYLSFFRLRFSMGLQYRAAALAGVMTQFFWGFMEILVYRAFYEAEPAAFPMSFEALVSYIWFQQAFLAIFMVWMMENELFGIIRNGDVAYELCRPIHVYDMWFVRSVANRVSRAILRCIPILLIVAFLPAPYGLGRPESGWHFVLFLVTLILGLLVTVSFCMVVYALTFFTISPDGLKRVIIYAAELFSGAIIPIPFFPENLRRFMEFLPFASMQNVALRVYSGDLSRMEMRHAISLQAIWVIALIVIGRWLFHVAETRVTVQGG